MLCKIFLQEIKEERNGDARNDQDGKAHDYSSSDTFAAE
jgi:hypothetical protein